MKLLLIIQDWALNSYKSLSTKRYNVGLLVFENKNFVGVNERSREGDRPMNFELRISQFKLKLKIHVQS